MEVGNKVRNLILTLTCLPGVSASYSDVAASHCNVQSRSWAAAASLTLPAEESASSNCVTIAYKIGAKTTEILSSDNLSSVRGVMVRSRGEEESWRWKSIASCFVGISELGQLSELQKLTGDLPYKRLLLFTNQSWSNSSGHPSFQQRAELLAIDRRHHPPLVLSPSDQEGYLVLWASCRRAGQNGGVELVTKKLNVWKSPPGTWALPPNIQGGMIERHCNGGQKELYGKVIRVSMFDTSPWVVFGKGKVSGVNADVLSALGWHFGFNPEFKMAPAWGYQLPNGTLVGSEGDVEEGRADVAVDAPLIYRGPDADPSHGNLSFSTIMYPVSGVFVTQRAKELLPIYSFLRPLRPAVWFCTVAALLCTIMFFFVNSGTQQYGGNLIANIWFMSFGIVYQEYYLQGYKTKTFQDRLVRFLWIITTFVLALSYQSNMRASLVVKDYEKDVGSLDELIERDLTLRVTSELRYWLTATAAQGDKVSEKLLTHLLRNNVTYILSVDTPQIVEQDIEEKGGAGFYLELDFDLRRAEKMAAAAQEGRMSPPPLVKVKEKFISSFHTLLLPYQSPRIALLNPAIAALTDAGVIDGMFKRYLSTAGIKEQVEASKPEPMDLPHIVIPSCLWVACLAAATAVLAAEVAKRQMEGRNENWNCRAARKSQARLAWGRTELGGGGKRKERKHQVFELVSKAQG